MSVRLCLRTPRHLKDSELITEDAAEALKGWFYYKQSRLSLLSFKLDGKQTNLMWKRAPSVVQWPNCTLNFEEEDAYYFASSAVDRQVWLQKKGEESEKKYANEGNMETGSVDTYGTTMIHLHLVKNGQCEATHE